MNEFEIESLEQLKQINKNLGHIMVFIGVLIGIAFSGVLMIGAKLSTIALYVKLIYWGL